MQNEKILYSFPPKSIVKVVLICLVSVLCFFKGVQHKANLELYNDKIIVVQNIDISGAQANEIQKLNEISENQYAFTIWGECRDMIVYNSDLNRETIVDNVVVCGRTDVILSGTYALETNDKNGCFIDEDTAYELFGDSNTTGQIIVSDNKSYIVRGIIRDMSNVFITQATEETGEILDTVTILRKDETTNVTVNNVFNLFRMQGHLLDYGFLMDSTSVLFLAVPIILSLYLLALIKSYRKRFRLVSNRRERGETILKYICKKYPIKYWIWLCIQIFCALLFVVVIFKSFHLIDDYIPTKWSDFGFWIQLWEEKMGSLEYLFKMEKRSPEILLYVSFLKANVFNLLSLVFLIFWLYEWNIMNLKCKVIKWTL